MFKEFPSLYTARLRLREIAPADVDDLFLIYSDATTMRWFGMDSLTTRAQAETITALFAHWYAAGTGVRWGLARLDDDRLTGSGGLFSWNKLWRTCMIGFELADSAQHHGYMREAVGAILEYGFLNMELNRIQAECHPENLPSIALLTRLGFQFEGIHRQQGCWGGQFHDLDCYSLLRDEWRSD